MTLIYSTNMNKLIIFHKQTNREICQWRHNTETSEGSDFIVGVEKSSHMQTAMLKPCIINILLANQREVKRKKKRELKELNNLCFCSFCTGPNILQYILLYNWITIHVISTAVTKKNFKSVTAVSSEQTFLLFDLSERPTPPPLTLMQLKWACYANVPSFYQTKCWVLHLFTSTAK